MLATRKLRRREVAKLGPCTKTLIRLELYCRMVPTSSNISTISRSYIRACPLLESAALTLKHYLLGIESSLKLYHGCRKLPGDGVQSLLPFRLNRPFSSLEDGAV